jgi:hypothetical protein
MTDSGCTGCLSTTHRKARLRSSGLPIDRRAKHIKTDNIDDPLWRYVETSKEPTGAIVTEGQSRDG